MYRTISERNQKIVWVILAIALIGIAPEIYKLIVSMTADDSTKYGTVENALSTILVSLAAVGLLYFYFKLFAIALYARARCSICERGITVSYRMPWKKERLFLWSSIGTVLLAATSSDKPELELRCFSADFSKNGKGFARRYPPESNIWNNTSIVVNHQTQMVTMQYSPELVEEIKRYHPDIIPYPNEKLIEGYMEFVFPKNR